MISPGMLLSERYEIIDKIGTGGMADVYNGRDLRLNRNVAIKILKPEYSNDVKFVAKFRGEAQSVAGLSHPNIVNVYDVGEDENYHYIVMELVEGITLKKYIERKGKLDVNEAIGIGIQIAQGMEEAHNNNIIHRDIKPQNIIISKEGKVKVTDFGIAKAATSNTITSNAMGSVHYISPEQARGGYSDSKSDIYSLGVTIFEMLAGFVPFQGDSTVSVAFAHVHEEPPILEQVAPEVPRSLSRIVEKCMQKKPDMRYESAADLILDLRRAVSEPDGNYVIIEEDMNDSPTIKLPKVKRVIQEGELPKENSAEKMGFEEEVANKDESDSNEALDPKLEKILKICSGIVAVIIVLFIVLLLVKVLMPTKGSKDSASSVASASQKPSSSSEMDDAETVEVPDIVDKSLEDAQEMLEDMKLRYRLEPKESDKDANIVIDQDPAAGEEVEEYTRVTIYYSEKESGVTIPDVSGMSQSEAQTELENKGLTVSEISKDYSDSVEKGKVIGTDPVVGTSVSKESSVKLIISKGPKSEMVTVPNIVGKNEEVALEKLNDVGLAGGKISYKYSETYAKGRVTQQSVSAGKEVKVGKKIDYTVSLGKKEKATPEPTTTPVYSYEGSVTINANPFDYEGDEDTIKLILTQDGKSKTVFNGKLSYSDFPKKFEIVGWSDNNGTITMSKGDDMVDGSWNIEFKKVVR